VLHERTTSRTPDGRFGPSGRAPVDRSSGGTELHPRTGEFRCHSTEIDYRSDQLHREAGRLTNTGFLAAAIMFGFTVVDLGSLGVSTEWAGLMAARATAAAAVAMLALHVRRAPGFFASRAGVRVITAVEALVLSVFLLVCAVRPEDVVTHSVSAVLMALVVAIFVPGTVRTTSLVVGTFFASYVAVAHLCFPAHVNLLALVANLGAATVFAYVVVTVLNRSRRSEWLATVEQRRVNDRLVEEAHLAEALRAELEQQASQDALTGLANRRAFFERGARLVESSRDSGGSAVAVVLDVDGFKLVNDRFGHAAGDALLKAIGSSLDAATRHDELVGRIGGEEFAVVATVPAAADGSALAERLRTAVRDAHVPVGAEAVSATASVGFAEVDPHEDLGAALARADKAMYAAKRAGGDRVLRDAGDVAARSQRQGLVPST
jgi:diguanylate cyclase (GGDEF)-like protein